VLRCIHCPCFIRSVTLPFVRAGLSHVHAQLKSCKLLGRCLCTYFPPFLNQMLPSGSLSQKCICFCGHPFNVLLPITNVVPIVVVTLQVRFAFVAGLAVALLLFPVNQMISKGIQRASVQLMKAKDARVGGGRQRGREREREREEMVCKSILIF